MRENERVHEVMAENVRRLLEQRGLTITHAAELAGLNRIGLSRVLSGQEGITIERLAKVADVLQVPAWTLLREADPGEG